MSQVMQSNIGDDDQGHEGEGNPETDWSTDISLRNPETFRIQLRGIPLSSSGSGAGVETIYLIGKGPLGENSSPGTTRFRHAETIESLIAPNQVREFSVQFDPLQGTFAVRRLVAAEHLRADVISACSLGHIVPEGICVSLKAKAKAAAQALSKGRTRAARGAVNAFLSELKAQGGKHVMEPALTILREEAEALLNPPPAFKPKPKPKPVTKATAKPTT